MKLKAKSKTTKQELRDLNLICMSKFDLFSRFQSIKSRNQLIRWIRNYHKNEKKE